MKMCGYGSVCCLEIGLDKDNVGILLFILWKYKKGCFFFFWGN